MSPTNSISLARFFRDQEIDQIISAPRSRTDVAP